MGFSRKQDPMDRLAKAYGESQRLEGLKAVRNRKLKWFHSSGSWKRDFDTVADFIEFTGLNAPNFFRIVREVDNPISCTLEELSGTLEEMGRLATASEDLSQVMADLSVSGEMRQAEMAEFLGISQQAVCKRISTKVDN